jgi:hypothetical protein
MRTYQSNGEASEDTAPRDEFEAFSEIALRTLSERVRTDDALAHDLYGALCNMRWCRRDPDSHPVSMSWRYAGGVVSHLACKGGCYRDYYCSGNEGVFPHAFEMHWTHWDGYRPRGRRTKGERSNEDRATRGARRVTPSQKLQPSNVPTHR